MLWGKKDLLDKMPPVKGGGDMIRSVSFEKKPFTLLFRKSLKGEPRTLQVL